MSPSRKRIVTSRYFMVPAAFAVVTLIWNIYVSLNNGGIVEGRVVNQKGAAVADAAVHLFAVEQTMSTERAVAKTSRNGDFRFNENDSHRIQLRAIGSDGSTSDLRIVRLYFKGQNIELTAPLVLNGN